MGGSQLAAVGANSISLRSPRGMGIVCAKHPTLARYGLWKTGGNILAGADDSALIYQLIRDKWQPVKIAAVGTPAPWASPRALAGGKAAGSSSKSVAQNGHCLYVGAVPQLRRPIRGAQLNSRWWLGRKVGAAASYGSSRDVGRAGIGAFAYDTQSSATAIPAAVGTVAFTLLTESFKQTYIGTSFGYQLDSLSTKVVLRR
jgi:hypothetical protein